jgi:division protein CdvB (Snf7/Vps24/ESCRT-III family)
VSGEKPAIRHGMDQMTKRLVEPGMASEKARKVAQDAAQRADRRERDKR